MIKWTEEEPDFGRRPVAELLSALPFTTACVVILGGGCSVRVLVLRPVLDAIWNHLREQHVEMGGLLIGQVYSVDEPTFLVSIEDFARGDEFHSTGVSLRLDTTVWESARKRLTDGRSVIGWYHSHPNLGAFFSDTDRRTQRSFFNQPHCLGLVIDPFRREEGWFIGGGSEPLAHSKVLPIHSRST